MSLFYTISYWLGFTPWEEAADHRPAVEHINALFDREEQQRQPPYGRALDLGSGRGHWSIVLAKRGWEVTGVELVDKAVNAARNKAIKEQVEVNFVRGDITTLQESDIGNGFNFIWDFGTIHGLTAEGRSAVGRQISVLAAPDATALILAWAPGSRGPLPRGASRQDIEDAFPDWKITDEEPFDVTGLPKPLRSVNPRVYRLRRA